jgi:hypothetical protein
MPFLFRTKNLDHSFYQNMVRRILYEFLDGYDMHQFLKGWTIEFHNLEFANKQFFEHVKLQEGQKINTNMPSGVTGQNQIILYLHDSKNIFKARENSDRIQHELCHAVMYFIYQNKKRKGKRHVMATEIVHGTDEKYHINYWYRKWLIWRKFQIAIIDIRNWTKLRKNPEGTI